MQKAPIVFLLAILFLFFTKPVIADTAVVYDSGKLAISAWHVHLSTHTIALNQPGKGYLNIGKNTPGMPIRAGFLMLNHRLIPITRFLSGPDTTFIKKIKLRRTNRIRVFLVGSPGASIGITVHAGTENPTPPTATLTATPLEITRGEPATLTWMSTNADTCMISPDIGSVDVSGSVSVSPVETTTYEIIATGAGGTSTASATVVVIQPAPTVEITVSPDAIHPGESATLSWNSTDAESCVIEPGIGDVAPSGSMTVSPTETTTYTITASGPGGTSSAVATLAVVPPITVQIISPADGESINRPDGMVRGSFSNISGSETGIIVNGMVAMVYDNQFVVNHIQLQEGSNTITVRATDIHGHSQTSAITVNAAMPRLQIEISPNIESGSSPLGLNLHITGAFSIEDSTLDHTGPEPVELFKTAPDEYQVSLIDEGIHYFKAEVIHEAVTYSDTVAIVVVDAAAIDALLQQKWADMKSKLETGDITGALQHFSEGTKPMFEYNFNLLNAHLNEIIAGMQSITLVKIEEGRAEYNLIGQQGGQSFSFFVLFQKTADGLWRIVNF